MNRTYDPGLGLSVLCDQLNSGGNVWASIKAPVKAATTANISLTGRQTIDGVALIDGDRVLVKDQTLTYQNGIYTASTFGSWGRAPDWDDSFDVLAGTMVGVLSGTANGGLHYRVTSSDPITVGVTGVSFAVAFSAASVSFTPSGTGATARTVQAKLREIEVNLADFGITNDGSTDNSTAWSSAIDYANTQASAAVTSGFPITTARLIVPSGDYVITTGKSVTNLNLVIEGNGKESTRIRIGSGQYLLTVSGTIYQFELRGISTSGGKGVLKHSATANNVQGVVVVEDNNFHDYTECAVGSLSADMPYWHVRGNVFNGASGLASKGIVLSGDNSGTVIERNAFLRNRYHIKLASNGQAAKIKNNDFIRFTDGGGSPALTDIWLLGSSVATKNGLLIEGNKFGNENRNAVDYAVLLADESTGTDSFDKNHATTASTNIFSGVTMRDNLVVGNDTPTYGVIYSYSPEVRGWLVDDCYSGSIFPYIVQFDSGVTVSEARTSENNTFRIGRRQDTFESAFSQISNEPSLGAVDDPLGLTAGYASFRQNHVSGFDPGFTDLWTTSTSGVRSFTLSNATRSNVADAVGEADAGEITYSTSAGFAYGYMAATTTDRLAWVEFELKAASSQALTDLQIDIRTDAQAICFRRFVKVPSAWQRFRFPWVPRSNSAVQSLQFRSSGFSSGVTDKVQIGRVRVYHANEPQNFGYAPQGKASTLLPSVTKASVVTTNVGNVGTGEDDLMTYAMPANSMNAAGKGVKITAWGTTANNSNTKTIKLYFGSLAILTTALTISQAGTWRATATVVSTGTDAQDYSSQLVQGGATTLVDVEAGTHTQDDGAAITVKCTGTVTDGGGGVNNNDIVQQGMLVEFLN